MSSRQACKANTQQARTHPPTHAQSDARSLVGALVQNYTQFISATLTWQCCEQYQRSLQPEQRMKVLPAMPLRLRQLALSHFLPSCSTEEGSVTRVLRATPLDSPICCSCCRLRASAAAANCAAHMTVYMHMIDCLVTVMGTCITKAWKCAQRQGQRENKKMTSVLDTGSLKLGLPLARFLLGHTQRQHSSCGTACS